jgi:uncharacterized protein YdaU (DUF1376 family)
MPLYIAEYRANTTHLNRSEHGAYFLLLTAMWSANGRLPSDDNRLARLAMCTREEWAEIRPTIMEFFTRRGGHIVQKRLSRELAKYEDRIVRAKRGGKASASKRVNENSAKPQNQVEPKANQLELESELRKKEPPLSPPAGGQGFSLLDLFDEAASGAPVPNSKRRVRSAHVGLNGHAVDFERWYAAYPKHVSRGRAERAFVAALTLTDTDTLIAGAKSYAARKSSEDRKFIAHPATWLNDKGWADEPDVQPVEASRFRPAERIETDAQREARLAEIGAKLREGRL